MAVNDFTGENIQDTYQRVVQTDGTRLADGIGSPLPISFDGNNVIISGSLTATEYSVTSSVTNVIFQQQSGSTIFGDSSDDTHLFTGSLSIKDRDIFLSSSGEINLGNGSTKLTTFVKSSYFLAGKTQGYKIGNNKQLVKMNDSETIIMLNSNDGPLEISGSAVDIKGPLTASIDGGKF